METHKNKEISSKCIASHVEPPPGLAERTCVKIWATLDDEEQGSEIDSGTFLNSAYFSPETFLPPAFLLQTSEPEEMKNETLRTAKNNAEKNKEIKKTGTNGVPMRSSRWLGLTASILVGIVIAFFLFPMVRYAEQSTRSYVTESWMGEINRRVDQYEQIHGNTENSQQNGEVLPFNLALSGWQELRSGTILEFLFPSSKSVLPFEKEMDRLENMHVDKMSKNSPADWRGLISSNDRSQILIPIGENMVRSAYGQGITIKDGRVFFRVLPSVETAR